MSLERIRDRATAKKPVVRETHSQGASGENPRQNHSQRVSGEKKNEVKQHEYKDRLAEQRSNVEKGRNDEKNREEQSQQQSQQNSRQEKRKANSRQEKSMAKGRQSKPKDCDRDKARYEEKYTVQRKAAATHPTSDADVQQQSIQSASQSHRNQEGSRTEHYRHSSSKATTGACDSKGTENGRYSTASVH